MTIFRKTNRASRWFWVPACAGMTGLWRQLIIKSPFLLILLIGFLGATPVSATEVQHAVFLRVYQQPHNWQIPWNRQPVRQQTGLALVTPKQRLLTTAELVAEHTLIEVYRPGDRYPAKATVLRTDDALNLALLEVADEGFWSGLQFPGWGQAQKGEVQVATAKVPDRWEQQAGTLDELKVGYRLRTETWIPVLQVQGMKASGPAGVPVLQADRVIGLALKQNDETWSVLSATHLQKFLEHTPANPNSALAHRGFLWTRVPQSSVTDHAGIPADVVGVWITRLLPFGTGSKVLRPGDLLTKIGDWPLSAEGQIEHPVWGAVLFDALFLEALKLGDSVELHLWRNGKAQTVSATVRPFVFQQTLVASEPSGAAPRYLIQGGLLFQELSLNYLRSWGDEWAKRAPLRMRLYKALEHANPETPTRRIVLLTHVLPDAINLGYQDLSHEVVEQINGIEITSLESVQQAFQHSLGEHHVIRLRPGSDRRQLILPARDLESANRRIQETFRIPQLQHLGS